jgi:hypothetical protein
MKIKSGCLGSRKARIVGALLFATLAAGCYGGSGWGGGDPGYYSSYNSGPGYYSSYNNGYYGGTGYYGNSYRANNGYRGYDGYARSGVNGNPTGSFGSASERTHGGASYGRTGGGREGAVHSGGERVEHRTGAASGEGHGDKQRS